MKKSFEIMRPSILWNGPIGAIMVGKYVCTARHRHGDHKLLLVEGPRSTVQYKQLADKVEKWG